MDLAFFGRTIQVAYFAVLGMLCIYGIHRYFLVCTFYRVRRARKTPDHRFDNLPTVTIQLPMFNERHVARRIIEQTCRMDYPTEKLEIQVLDDSTDQTVAIARDAVERMRAAGHNVVYLHRDDRTGYKAGALQAGLAVARGEFIAIFDADFIPPPNMLRDSIHHFSNSRVGMVQSRWDHLNRSASILTEAQAILLDGHFLIEHTARNRSGRFMSFNGTAGIWRRSAIHDAGGWQHDTLTEDLDLSYRAQLRGWKFVFLPDLTSPAELPPEMNAFKSQQHRWTKGGAQTCVKLLPKVFRSDVGWRVKFEAFFHLTSGSVYILMVLLSLLIGPALLAKLVIQQQTPGWHLAFDFLLFFVGTGSALAFYIVSQRQIARRWRDIFRAVPSLMSIGIGIALNNAAAALEGFFSKSGEFVRTPKFGTDAGVAAGGYAVTDADADVVAAAGAETGADADTARTAPPRPARVRFRGAWKAWTELGLAIYLTACLCSFFFFDHWFERVSAAFPFLGLFIFGYSYVAYQSFRSHWLAARSVTVGSA